MESLATTVSIIMATMIFSGPVSLLLSWQKVQLATASKAPLNALRKATSTFLATIGILFAANILFSGVPLTVSLIALACVNMNILAIRNEYFRHIR